MEKGPNASYRSLCQAGTAANTIDEFESVVVALPNNWTIPAIEWGGQNTCGDAMRAHHAHYDYPAHYLRVSVLFEKPFWRHRVAIVLHARRFSAAVAYTMRVPAPGDTQYGVLGWLLAGEAARCH